MSYELQLDMLPGGIAVQAAKEGERALVQVAGVATSEDGEVLIRYLGFAGQILNQLVWGGNAAIACSQVDNFLAIIRRDRTATVYVNELHIISKVRIARAFEAGEPVSKNDVVDIEEARLGDVSIPDDAGVIVVVSHEWRKAVLFDFAPLGDDRPPCRHYDIWPTLGQLVARLMFQERFSISEDDWKKFFVSQWFPFAGLNNTTVETLLGHVRAGWGISELITQLKEEVLGKLDGFVNAWGNKAQFQAHMPLLEHAIERFKAEDYTSCVAVLMPRIEGIMRDHHAICAPSEPRTQSALSARAVESQLSNPFSLLLPARFEEYLREVFFANFDDLQQIIPLNRNSAGHGVAAAATYNLETAILALLICHQLFYCFPLDQSAEAL